MTSSTYTYNRLLEDEPSLSKREEDIIKINIYIYIYMCVCVCVCVCVCFKTSGDAFRLPYPIAFDCSIRPFLELFPSWLYGF